MSQGTWRAEYAHSFIALPPQIFVASKIDANYSAIGAHIINSVTSANNQVTD